MQPHFWQWGQGDERLFFWAPGGIPAAVLRT